ncbi:hypothetical protein BC936DRAFT_149668 [Jimgerdemannia flammicorona]|uniref:Uncharacterized protein n=1 Tax=Jimgerdemannia flammicorona TaxID=994334 RepID=A0A433D0D6_9FUNG|nr:hypothetical protein BC936DRAFT_149668 [Jimgerdemannia flammicorona]
MRRPERSWPIARSRLGERQTAEPHTRGLGGRTLKVSDIRREEGTAGVRTSLLVEKAGKSWSPFLTLQRPVFTTASDMPPITISLVSRPLALSFLPSGLAFLPSVPSSSRWCMFSGAAPPASGTLSPGFYYSSRLAQSRHPTDGPTYWFSNKQANQSATIPPSPSRHSRVDFKDIETPWVVLQYAY